MLFLFFFPIRTVLIFVAGLLFCAGYLHAAPLESGFAAAPPPSASQAEKTAAFREARLQVLAAAGKYERTPYRYGGLDKRGLDCSGLVYISFQDALGVTIPRNTWTLYSWVEKIQIQDANPGDLVFFNTTGKGTVSHVGIFTGERRFIHAASDGPKKGVIYSSLDEQYWSRTYAGAGRALPGADISGSTGGKNRAAVNPPKPDDEKSNILIGFAAAPTWNTFAADGGVLRGAVGQLRVGAAGKPFGQSMIFGLELRPEWDGTLGVFRLPLTLSWGLNDRVRIYAGPALSFGDAVLSVSGETRYYTGGTAWFGAAGITIAPFIIKIAGNDLAPYAELAWQSYSSNNANENWGADFSANVRFSTGLRYTWRR